MGTDEGERRRNKPQDESDRRKIVSFVDPDPMVEFDPRISRVGTRFVQVCLSSLSFESSPHRDATSSPFARNFSYFLSLYLSLVLALRRSRHLVHSTKTKEATGLS